MRILYFIKEKKFYPQQHDQVSVSDTVCPSGFSADAHRGGRKAVGSDETMDTY